MIIFLTSTYDDMFLTVLGKNIYLKIKKKKKDILTKFNIHYSTLQSYLMISYQNFSIFFCVIPQLVKAIAIDFHCE